MILYIFYSIGFDIKVVLLPGTIEYRDREQLLEEVSGNTVILLHSGNVTLDKILESLPIISSQRDEFIDRYAILFAEQA